jgi:hypothetical protein
VLVTFLGRRVYLVVRETAQALHEEFKQIPVLERDGFIKRRYRQVAEIAEVGFLSHAKLCAFHPKCFSMPLNVKRGIVASRRLANLSWKMYELNERTCQSLQVHA